MDRGLFGTWRTYGGHKAGKTSGLGATRSVSLRLRRLEMFLKYSVVGPGAGQSNREKRVEQVGEKVKCMKR
jgi:hypothetical protein